MSHNQPLRIYIARHGQDEDNARGILNGHRNELLTNTGVEQARLVGEGIKKLGVTFDAVYASPLKRAKHTATIAGKINGFSPVVLDDLIERDFGVMTGKLVADIERLCAPDIIKTDRVTYFLSPEGAETFSKDLPERAERVLAYLRKQHPDGGTILLVTHGDIGKMIYAAYYKIPWEEILTKFYFGNSDLLLLSEDSGADDAHVLHIEQRT